ncbi:uncharacterized protein LOC108141740 [Drosophila elegans]|uniref:uncharacterized protein LOC108141740 n=1 Tax=Drosophila elegans TaxID=30023 RepID=UPI0007E8B563|nr:uncharacterized protein LOC108141740 [Drosophila elegans]
MGRGPAKQVKGSPRFAGTPVTRPRESATQRNRRRRRNRARALVEPVLNSNREIGQQENTRNRNRRRRNRARARSRARESRAPTQTEDFSLELNLPFGTDPSFSELSLLGQNDMADLALMVNLCILSLVPDHSRYLNGLERLRNVLSSGDSPYVVEVSHDQNLPQEVQQVQQVQQTNENYQNLPEEVQQVQQANVNDENPPEKEPDTKNVNRDDNEKDQDH